MEIAKPAQGEATGSHSMNCTLGLYVCPTHAAHLWGCSVLTMLILLPRDVVKQFVCTLLVQNMLPDSTKMQSLGAEKFDISYNTLHVEHMQSAKYMVFILTGIFKKFDIRYNSLCLVRYKRVSLHIVLCLM